MDNLAFAPGTFCTSKATAAAGTTTTFSTTGATLYCIKGKAFTTSAAANAATPTTDATTGATAAAAGAAGLAEAGVGFSASAMLRRQCPR